MQRSASTYRFKQRIVSSGLVLLLVFSILAVLRPQEPAQELKADQDQEIVIATPDDEAVVSTFSYDFAKDYIIAYILPEVKENYRTVEYAFVPSLISSLGDLFPNTISINAP